MWTNKLAVANLEVGSKLLSHARAKAEALNSHFCSVYVPEDMSNIPSLGPSIIPKIDPLIFSCNGVKKQLQSLKDDEAPGPWQP